MQKVSTCGAEIFMQEVSTCDATFMRKVSTYDAVLVLNGALAMVAL